jgi:hypothetical protein
MQLQNGGVNRGPLKKKFEEKELYAMAVSGIYNLGRHAKQKAGA